ncbi:sensor histidine kinase [Solibacillus daqui]|uniref:sensor histidine kinase n=1 Tax=Solibacillus daqui TaxID=2912187 RepID=UPI002366F076|nr:HAMP domain-containing sensor histidine kinase [Solibacillus daqui]
MEDEPETRHLSSDSNSSLWQTFSIEEGDVLLDSKWLSILEKQGKWLQVLDSHGRVLASSQLPSDVPSQYEIGALLAYWEKSMPFPYEIALSREEKDGQSYFVVVGQKSEARHLFERLIKEWNGLDLSQQGANLLEESHGSLQIFDVNGQRVQQYGYGKAVNTELVLDDLLGSKADELRENGKEYVYYDPTKRQTWVVEVDSASEDKQGVGDKLPQYMTKAISLYSIALLLFIVLASLWYGKRFGRPFLYIINFIQQLAEGNYRDMQDTKGRSYILDRRGKLKRSYRLFQEVNDSLQGLKQELQENEQLRKHIEQTREEWIVGVSHDLKTPLSSIKGYAHLLESAPYQWSQEEFQMIGKTLREKSTFMSELIDDLSITYRLKNNALPLERKPQEVNETIRRSVIHFMNDPQFTTYEISFHASEKTIMYPIDTKWFTRIIDNMISNAIKHNPPHTQIDIIVKTESEHGFSVTIRDHGYGMDQATLDNLFERYYRGTNSEENTSGSGLGMSIAKQLTVAHEGEISVISKQGYGTEIILYFGHL